MTEFFFFLEIVGLLHPLLFYPASNNIFNTNFFVLFFVLQEFCSPSHSKGDVRSIQTWRATFSGSQ